MNLRCLVVLSMLVLAPSIARAELDTMRRYAPTEPDHRLGVDGLLSIGIVPAVGGSLRYEYRIKTEGFLIVRGGLYRGVIAYADEGAEFDATLANLGYRGYWGRFHATIELGIAGIRKHRWQFDDDHHGVDWFPLPSASLAIGAKLGVVDIGVSTMFPFVGIGAYLGFDFVQL